MIFNMYSIIQRFMSITSGIPALNELVFVGMGEGIGSGSFSNYPRGYWGATVVACDAETEEWVLRFDETYGEVVVLKNLEIRKN